MNTQTNYDLDDYRPSRNTLSQNMMRYFTSQKPDPDGQRHTASGSVSTGRTEAVHGRSEDGSRLPVLWTYSDGRPSKAVTRDSFDGCGQ